MRPTEPFKGKRVLLAKTKTSISVGVRKAPCFCSSCKDQIWHACRVAVKFPYLVDNMREEKLCVVKSTYSFGTPKAIESSSNFPLFVCLLLIVNHGHSFMAPAACPFSPTCGRRDGSGWMPTFSLMCSLFATYRRAQCRRRRS